MTISKIERGPHSFFFLGVLSVLSFLGRAQAQSQPIFSGDGQQSVTKASDTPTQQIEVIQNFFATPENKVKIQFPIPETGYAWQNMSRFYPTAQVLRAGPISTLPVKLDDSIGKITFKIGDKTETVEQHLAN